MNPNRVAAFHLRSSLRSLAAAQRGAFACFDSVLLAEGRNYWCASVAVPKYRGYFAGRLMRRFNDWEEFTRYTIVVLNNLASAYLKSSQLVRRLTLASCADGMDDSRAGSALLN
jgi:hypothetical protein